MKDRNTTHNMAYSAEYARWNSLIQRCTNPTSKAFKDYGARGIAVCDAWLNSFEVFYRDMGPRPSMHHTIERINNNLGYSPDNCRWATRREQASNRRSSRMLTWNGQTKTLMEWSRETGIPYLRLRKRVDTNKPLEQVFQASKIKPPGRPIMPRR